MIRAGSNLHGKGTPPPVAKDELMGDSACASVMFKGFKKSNQNTAVPLCSSWERRERMRQPCRRQGQ